MFHAIRPQHLFQQLHYNYDNTAVVGIYSIMRCVYHFLHGHICRYLVLPLFYTRFDKVTSGPNGVGDALKQMEAHPQYTHLVCFHVR
jgi:hypothetical protein